MSTEKPREGWFRGWNMRKAHYMVRGRSLCGRWGCLLSAALDCADDLSLHKCSGCRKRLARRRARHAR